MRARTGARARARARVAATSPSPPPPASRAPSQFIEEPAEAAAIDAAAVPAYLTGAFYAGAAAVPPAVAAAARLRAAAAARGGDEVGVVVDALAAQDWAPAPAAFLEFGDEDAGGEDDTLLLGSPARFRAQLDEGLEFAAASAQGGGSALAGAADPADIVDDIVARIKAGLPDVDAVAQAAGHKNPDGATGQPQPLSGNNSNKRQQPATAAA